MTIKQREKESERERGVEMGASNQRRLTNQWR